MKPKKIHYFRAIGLVLVIASILAVFKLRPHEISSADFISHHELLGLNAWQLRWKFGWESSREYPVISGIPTPALTWKIENGGVGIFIADAVIDKTITVKTHQPVTRTKPDKTARVADELEDRTASKPVIACVNLDRQALGADERGENQY